MSNLVHNEDSTRNAKTHYLRYQNEKKIGKPYC